jgi:hypothetical protein
MSFQLDWVSNQLSPKTVCSITFDLNLHFDAIYDMLINITGVDMSTMSGFFELNNGCICCTVKDDLVSTLEQLALHKDNFDYILIEATGKLIELILIVNFGEPL